MSFQAEKSKNFDFENGLASCANGSRSQAGPQEG